MDLLTTSPGLDELRRRRSYKWRAYPPDVLPAFVAEMDYPLAPAVAEAVTRSVALGDCGYAWPDPELGAALAGFARDRFAWHIDTDDVILIPDVMAGVTEVLRLATRRGDGVVINTPVYPPFFSHLGAAGCRVDEVPLARSGDGWALDLDAMARAFSDGARVWLFCNPHNPTGRVFTRDELLAVVDLASRFDVLLLADEIHAPLALPGAEHIPLLSLGEEAASRTIAFVSASKGWNIPGLKCAQAVVASDPMRTLVRHLGEDVTFAAGNLGIVASIAAYRDSVAWLDSIIAAIDSNRHRFEDLLASRIPSFGYRPPDGGYLAWVDCRVMGDDVDPADVFLDRGRVALRSGAAFGAPGAGWARVTIATSPAILEEIVDRMAIAVG